MIPDLETGMYFHLRMFDLYFECMEISEILFRLAEID